MTVELPAFFRDGLAIMCTGRGTHRRKDLFQAHIAGGTVEIAKRRYGAGAAKTGPGPRMSGAVWLGNIGARNKQGEKLGRAQNFECTVCHRKPSINFESIGLLLQAGYKELDLSYAEDAIRIVKHLASQ